MTIHNTFLRYFNQFMLFLKRTNKMLNDSETHLRYVREQERDEATDIRGF